MYYKFILQFVESNLLKTSIIKVRVISFGNLLNKVLDKN
jgi:hypothetical protein